MFPDDRPETDGDRDRSSDRERQRPIWLICCSTNPMPTCDLHPRTFYLVHIHRRCQRRICTPAGVSTIEHLNIWRCICDHSSAFSKWGIWFPVVKHRKGLKEEEGWHWGKSRKGWYWPPHPLQSTHMPLEYLFILHQKGKKGRIKNGQPLGSKNIHLHPAHIFIPSSFRSPQPECTASTTCPLSWFLFTSHP